MLKKFIVFINIIIMILLYSCAKKEPAQSPDSDILTNKISIAFSDLNINLAEEKARDLFDGGNNTDFSKIENFSVIQSEQGEAGIFKLYSESNADYIKNIAAERILKLQEEAGGSAHLNIANNAEARSYGNYVYYASHAEKDRIFKIIEDELKGA